MSPPGRDRVEDLQPATWKVSVFECFALSLMCRAFACRPSDLRIFVGDMSSTKSKLWPKGPSIPRLDVSSGLVGFLFGPVAPSDVLVVGAVVVEAAVQDADEAVPESSEGGVVGVAGGPADVVVAAGSG